jgi:thiamine-phosphate pyrophosphorylase
VRGLYAIVDVDVLAKRQLELLPFAEAVLDAHPAALQLRAKNETPERTLALLRSLRPLCTAANVPLVANDRPDLALIGGADMVHVGQTDASPSIVRTVAPQLGFGMSTHTPEQLSKALRAMPTYIAYGPVWSTLSKSQPDPVVDVAGMRQAARLVRHNARETGFDPPLVAIGGVTLDRLMEIAAYASAFAVISDLVPPPDLVGVHALDYARIRAGQYKLALEDPTRLERPSLIVS